jgi:hypothetical protein
MQEGFANDWMHIYSDEIPKWLSKYPIPLNTAFPVTDAKLIKKRNTRHQSRTLRHRRWKIATTAILTTLSRKLNPLFYLSCFIPLFVINSNNRPKYTPIRSLL